MERQYICMLVLGYVTFCYGQEVSVVLPSRCAAESCAVPVCPNPVFREGECCPLCFQNCHLVRCGVPPENCVTPPGQCCPICQLIEKPGTCPQLRNEFGHCAERCSNDQHCPGLQKCCSVGCGRDCMNPNNTHKTCTINGEVVDHGATVTVDCNNCTCNDGIAICTEKACAQQNCFSVKCPPLPPRCGVIKPRGQCCPICQGNRGYGRRRRRNLD